MTRLIVEADGGSRGNPGPAAFGALVRSADSGDVLAEVGETIGVATNNVAEYRGLIAGLEMAFAIDPEADVEARLDSKLVVEQMSGRWKIKHPDMKPLALEAQRIFAPGHVTYTWVPRAQNAHADRLLNDALDGKPKAAPSAAADQNPGAGSAPAVSMAEPLVVSEPPESSAAGLDAGEESETSQSSMGVWNPALDPPTTLVLVRHGQTPMTKARAFSGGGVIGPSLDDVGLRQVKWAAEFLAGSELLSGLPPADPDAVAARASSKPVIVASPMQRTRETAEVIAAQLGVADVVVDEQWREFEFGAWEGLTFTEISKRYPDEIARWFASTSFEVPGGGESLDKLIGRIAGARDRIVSTYPGRIVVVVTHSMPIRTLASLTMEAPTSAVFRMQPAPGSVTEVQVYGDGTTALAGFNHRP